MKLLRITAAIAILSARADAQCEFCSNGEFLYDEVCRRYALVSCLSDIIYFIRVHSGISNPDFAIPDSGGQTCGSIAEFASSLEGDICDSIKMAELHCCTDSMAGAPDPAELDEEKKLRICYLFQSWFTTSAIITISYLWMHRCVLPYPHKHRCKAFSTT